MTTCADQTLTPDPHTRLSHQRESLDRLITLIAKTSGGGAMTLGAGLLERCHAPLWGQELQDQEFHQVWREEALLPGSVCYKG